MKKKEEMLMCICKEARLRKNYLREKSIETIYLGGGTPSVLSVNELKKMFEILFADFKIEKNAEITLEANPDDLTEEYLNDLKKETPVNRISMGVQSFINNHLIWMNRRHTSEEAEKSILLAQKAGFTNINADLIYGIPGMSNSEWSENLEKMIMLNVQHISAYHLTIEPDTIFGRKQKKGLTNEVDEDISLQHFEILLDITKKNEFDQYEISNFARKGFYSIHNMNYWKQGTYLGLGPSAHSFDGLSRQWNVKINKEYIDGINRGEGYYEKEVLTPKDLLNEYVMLSLRTKWGIDLNFVKEKFGEENRDCLYLTIRKYLKSNHIIEMGNNLILSVKGKFVSDYIITELFSS